MEAGPGDTMEVEVDSATFTGASYAIGTAFQNAIGGILSYPEGTRFRVQYPNNIFLTMFNKGTFGSYAMSFNYLDKEDPKNAELTDLYTVEEVAVTT